MKTTLLLSLLLLGILHVSYGQDDQLLLKKKNSHKEKVLTEGKSIRIITMEKQTLKGRFEIISDSLLTIAGDTVATNEIQRIRTKSLGGKITGGILSGGGGIITTFGAIIIITTFSAEGLAPLVGILIGIPLTGVGIVIATTGVLVLSIGKNYRHTKWNYEIVQK
jgi:hypothetical protein